MYFRLTLELRSLQVETESQLRHDLTGEEQGIECQT